LEERGIPPDCTAVVNLGGAPILNAYQWWTKRRQAIVRDSHVKNTQSLANLITKAKLKPEVFVSISGAGIYSDSLQANNSVLQASTSSLQASTSTLRDESSPLQEVGHQGHQGLVDFWMEVERVAKLPPEAAKYVREVVLRTGLIIGRAKGDPTSDEGNYFREYFFWPSYFSLLARFHAKNDAVWMSWIHGEDFAAIVRFCIENSRMRGAVNAVSPQGTRPMEFYKALVGPKKIGNVPLPPVAYQWMLDLERTRMFFLPYQVVPKKLDDAKFAFEFDAVETAFNQFRRRLLISDENQMSVLLYTFIIMLLVGSLLL